MEGHGKLLRKNVVRYDVTRSTERPTQKYATVWLHHILNLRLVCRDWCQGVDNFYENLPLHFDIHLGQTDGLIPSEGYQVKKVGWWTQMNIFDETRNLLTTKFQHHFDHTHLNVNTAERNPILGRSVTFIYRFELTIGDILNDYCLLLEKYGRHIWYCTIQGKGFYAWEMFYVKLKSLLQFMPNLKVLQISDSRSNFSFNYEDLLLLEEVMKRGRPLEKLKNLQFLNLGLMPIDLLNKLVRCNRHVAMLQVTGSWCHDKANRIYKEQFQNLKQLSLKLCSNMNFEQLQASTANWPLTKLNLDLGDLCGKDMSFIKWSRVFSMLEVKWANTLTDVELCLPAAKSNENEKDVMSEFFLVQLQLPHVKRLRLTMKNYACLDFILPMKNSLEFLRVISDNVPQEYGDHLVAVAKDTENNQKIQFLNYSSKLQYSNIWMLFSRLQSINCSEQQRRGEYWDKSVHLINFLVSRPNMVTNE